MKRNVIIILVLAAAIAGGVIYQRHMEGRPVAEAAAVQQQAVSVEPVRVAPMVDSIVSYGNLVSDRSVNIVAQTGARYARYFSRTVRRSPPGRPWW